MNVFGGISVITINLHLMLHFNFTLNYFGHVKSALLCFLRISIIPVSLGHIVLSLYQRLISDLSKDGTKIIILMGT